MISILNKHREMDGAVLLLQLFGHNLHDYLPRVLIRCPNIGKIPPFLVRGRLNVIQDVKDEFNHPAYRQNVVLDRKHPSKIN
ncbi:hypothetical protein [Sphingomonas faeni]|uniref:hypothetical protein n=1 Tax=Sphingomonas faeni TaxID=185950 RepID=UPI001ABF409A|nr:hypothetical protein [Sphingomonas faeni]